MPETRDEVTTWVGGQVAHWKQRARDADARLEQLQAELADAADALRAVGKAALAVAPTLRKPYPDAPETSPWTQFMEQPARRAYNLGVRIHRLLETLHRSKETADHA